MKPNGAASSPPVQLIGPDSRELYVGFVKSKLKTSENIGTSDVSSETRDFLEVHLTVQSHTTLEYPMTPEETGKLKEIVNEVPSGMTLRFFFKPNEKIQVGDRIEITTRTPRSISQGWSSREHGATFRLLSGKSK